MCCVSSVVVVLVVVVVVEGGREEGGGGEGERLIEPSGPKFPSRLLKLNSLVTIRWLIPSTVSLRRTGVEQLHQVKRMIGGIADMLISIYFQT